MLRESVFKDDDGRSVVLMDSISYVSEADEGQVIVSASHGGQSSGEYACRHEVGFVLFNDAGVGKADAGRVALGMLHNLGRAGAVIAHTSARIGDARDHWDNGVISAANEEATNAGVKVGQTVQDAVKAWLASTPTHK